MLKSLFLTLKPENPRKILRKNFFSIIFLVLKFYPGRMFWLLVNTPGLKVENSTVRNPNL